MQLGFSGFLKQASCFMRLVKPYEVQKFFIDFFTKDILHGKLHILDSDTNSYQYGTTNHSKSCFSTTTKLSLLKCFVH